MDISKRKNKIQGKKMKLKTLLAYLYLAIYTDYAPDFLVVFINQAC